MTGHGRAPSPHGLPLHVPHMIDAGVLVSRGTSDRATDHRGDALAERAQWNAMRFRSVGPGVARGHHAVHLPRGQQELQGCGWGYSLLPLSASSGDGHEPITAACVLIADAARSLA